MSTYLEIEQGRVQRQYVYYEFYKMDPKFPNAWSTEYPWCKYWVSAKNGVSRRSLFEDSIRDHDMYRDSELYDSKGVKKTKNYNDVMAALDKKFEEFNVSPSKRTATYEHFRKVTSINTKDLTCKLAIYGGARVYMNQIIDDINASKSEKEIGDVLNKITEQLNVAALNGAFAKVYNVVNTLGKNAALPELADKKLEKLITDMYNNVVYGDRSQKPIDIPKDPEVSFVLPRQIYEYAVKFENEHGKTPNEIEKHFIENLRTLVNKQANLNR